MAVLPTFVISKRQKEDMWALDIHRQGTDLGNLIGTFDFGYFTVWKFSNFPGTLILCEINFS